MNRVFAVIQPPSGGSGRSVPAAPAVHTIVTGGMPGWQITLIAAAAIIHGAVAGADPATDTVAKRPEALLVDGRDAFRVGAGRCDRAQERGQ